MRGPAIASLLVGLAACQGAPPEPFSAPPDIAALKWLDAKADPVMHLTQQPSTCLTAPEDPAVQRGALLFESPMLLGGQAAKAGLSCAACHRNGRGNPDFVFVGISGAPGTADVTHGLFSKIRADNVFNPVPIPDLASADGQSRVDRNRDGALETFLSAQIVEEFSGTPPDPFVISGLAAYIRALDASACPQPAREPQSWRRETELIKAVLAPETAASITYINAMRAAAGRLHERFPASQHQALRESLVDFSRVLAAGQDLDELKAALTTLESMLAAADATSFYDPATVVAALP